MFCFRFRRFDFHEIVFGSILLIKKPKSCDSVTGENLRHENCLFFVAHSQATKNGSGVGFFRLTSVSLVFRVPTADKKLQKKNASFWGSWVAFDDSG